MSDDPEILPPNTQITLWSWAPDAPPKCASASVGALARATVVVMSDSAASLNGLLGDRPVGLPLSLREQEFRSVVPSVVRELSEGARRGRVTTLRGAVELDWWVTPVSRDRWEEIAEHVPSGDSPPDLLVHWSATPVPPSVASCLSPEEVELLLKRFSLDDESLPVNVPDALPGDGRSRARRRLDVTGITLEQIVELAALSLEAHCQGSEPVRWLQVGRSWAVALGMQESLVEAEEDGVRLGEELADRVLPPRSDELGEDVRRESLIDMVTGFAVGWRFLEVFEARLVEKLIGPVESVIADHLLVPCDLTGMLEDPIDQLLSEHGDVLRHVLPADAHSDADHQRISTARRAGKLRLALGFRRSMLSGLRSVVILELVDNDADHAPRVERVIQDLVMCAVDEGKAHREHLRPLGLSEEMWELFVEAGEVGGDS